MRFIAPLLLSLGLAAPVARAHAESSPGAAVRGYFQALARQDFGGALALTAGAALARTSHMVDTLKSEAAAHHARVEVKVTNLDVRAPGAPDARGVPVPVAFHIDVVGHKWCFSKVARKLDGEARFYVDPSRPDRIVAIEGKLVE
ncbi:MAG: hypothetical protein JWM53_1513 [bacterium]|nr:hypothetical protein [bacterium]